MASADFSSYLNFVCNTPRYQETLSRYTATDAIHLVLEAQTVVRNVDQETQGRGDAENRNLRFPLLRDTVETTRKKSIQS
ncbi:MAG: hypothetical protein F6J86_36150 [Symploca sp. SIO1B1]|nr:hypothetical protein [Symploca sp. SIO1B1]